jgi:hypothetical protein
MLVRLFGGVLGAAEQGFEEMNAALKSRVEAMRTPGVLA